MTTAVQKIDLPFEIADPMVSMIERFAMDPNASIEKLEQMLAMKERMDAKSAERAHAAAFAAAASEFPTIPLNGKGHNNKPYALLKDIIAITRPILARHGLTLNWAVQVSDRVIVTAKLAHTAGHVESTSLILPLDTSGSKNPVQAVGSTQAYGQRYTAQAILGLSLGDDTDDDGKSGGKADLGTISADQFRAIRELMDQAGGDEAKFLRFFKIETLHELPVARFGEADAMLRKKIAAKGDANA